MTTTIHTKIIAIALACAATAACGAQEPDDSWNAPDNTGAGSGELTGGSSSGGAASGGTYGNSDGATGGAESGGADGSGGEASGGSEASGGAASGGAEASGGAASGGAEASGGSSGWTYPAGVTKPRIMIVGDSISAGPGCYKKYLLQNLNDNGYSNLEFVGQYNDDCGGGVKHSAVSCSTATHYTQASFTMQNCSQGTTFPGMSTLVSSHNPDLIMIQLGVNDVWGGQSVEAILGKYATLVEQARAHNASVAVVVAQIHKISPSCSSNDSKTKVAESLANAVPVWAQGLNTAQSPVFVADLWTNSDWSMAETSDCVHPNDVGARKMGLNWYNALKEILKTE